MSDPLVAPVADVILDGSVLVVCTDRDRLGFYRDMLGERGYHVICEEDPARAVRQLARNRNISVVFLDIGPGTSTWLEGLKPEGVLRDGVEYVVALDREEDAAAAPPHAEKLAKPFGRGQLLGAVNSAFNLARMQRFRLEEMRTLESSLQEFKTRTLAAVTQFMARTQGMRGVSEAVELAPNSLEALAAEECRRARLRDRIFGPLGLSHASWLLLLVMAEAQWAGAELTVKSAAYSAGLPLSSALRKINEMCARDLILKRGDPHDARRSYVTLTPSGQATLARYLSELNPGERSAVSGRT